MLPVQTQGQLQLCVCLVVRRNQQVAELFVYILHISHFFPRGRYISSFLVSTRNLYVCIYLFKSKWGIFCKQHEHASELHIERFS